MCYYNGIRVSRDQYINLLELQRQIEQLDLLRPGEWISDGLPEERISNLATSRFAATEMHAYTIQKDFRSASQPSEAFRYEELSELNF